MSSESVARSARLYRLNPCITNFGRTDLSLVATGLLMYFSRYQLKQTFFSANDLQLATRNATREQVIAALEELQRAAYVNAIQDIECTN